MSNLSLESVDLISIQRSAPRNGAASSQDYNDSAREVLRDLVSIAELLNNGILPMLGALPESAKYGLSGATVYASTDDTGPVFFNNKTGEPYTVAEIVSNLTASNKAVLQKVEDLAAKVLKLQTLLSTTGQTDILASVQSFSDQIKNLGSMINTIKGSLGAYEARFQQTKTVRMEIAAVPALTSVELDVSWDIPYPSNDYTATLSIEDATGSLQLSGWTKLADGRGLHVTVHNSSTGEVGDAILHMTGHSDAPAVA